MDEADGVEEVVKVIEAAEEEHKPTGKHQIMQRFSVASPTNIAGPIRVAIMVPTTVPDRHRNTIILPQGMIVWGDQTLSVNQ